MKLCSTASRSVIMPYVIRSAILFDIVLWAEMYGKYLISKRTAKISLVSTVPFHEMSTAK